MSRTLSAKDLRPRKTRKDKGKKRKLYAGRPVKKKREIKFERRIGNKEYIKIWIWQRVPMSHKGWKMWNHRVRNKVKKIITIMLNVHQVHTSEINTEDKICQFMEDNYWAGTFLVMGFSNAKNRYHCKPVKICRILIQEKEWGNHAKIINNYRLSRYKWFFKDV